MFISNYNLLASRAISTYDWTSAPQSLLIYGPNGVGKTKLLTLLVANMKKARVRTNFLNALNFSRQFTQAIQNRTLASFRAELRNSEILVVDGLELLTGKSASIEELYHTYEHLSQCKGKMVFSLSTNSLQLGFLGERFASRVMSGVVIEIASPQAMELERYLETEAHRLGLVLDSEIIPQLGRNIKNPAQAKEALEGFIRFAISKEQALSYDCFSEYWLERTAFEETALTPDNIIRLVAETMQVTVQDLKGNSRKSCLNIARQIAIFLIRTYTTLSYSQIGEYFGRGHTAMIDACQKLRSKMSEDSELQTKMNDICKMLEHRGGMDDLTKIGE